MSNTFPIPEYSSIDTFGEVQILSTSNAITNVCIFRLKYLAVIFFLFVAKHFATNIVVPPWNQ